jgi:hypothetical protein
VGGLGFSSAPTTFPGLQVPPPWVGVTPPAPGSSVLQLQIQNDGVRQFTDLIVNTLSGSFDDPTIVNNPDKDGTPG